MFCSVPFLAFVITFGLNACQNGGVRNPVQREAIVGAGPEDTFESMLQFGLENLAADEQIEIFHKDGKIDWDVSNNTASGLRKHDCEGDANAVAKCAGKLIDGGGCVIANKNPDGTYSADGVKCP